MPRLLLLVALLLVGCSSHRADGDRASSESRWADAAGAYGRAAIEAGCPQRSELLLLRAEMQDADGTHQSAADTIEKAVTACNGHPPAIWVRAQRRLSEGDRPGALADASSIADQHPAAAQLKAEIDRLNAQRDDARNRAAEKLASLLSTLDVEAEDSELKRADPAGFARTPPVPMTAKYAVRQTAYTPDAFELTWTEELSYRGEAGGETYYLVRKLEVPELENSLPWPVRLTMSNQRQAMRFEIDQQGKVVAAQWHQDGPERGMRPQMLRPEIEGGLQRKRLYDPGETGTRAVGESWSGKDVRVLDGRPVTLSYTSKFVAWESVRGVQCARIETQLRGPATKGPQTKGKETIWMHPESSVEVQWRRQLEYPTVDPDGSQRRWSEALQAVLIEVTGHR
jgi:hypothetical protein